MNRSGAESLPGYWQNRAEYLDIEWQGCGWEYVNPVDDRIAEQMDIRNGLDSRQAIIARRRGRDAEEVDKEIAEDNKRADSLRLVLDSDPRQTAQSGALQKAAEAAVMGGKE
jgi:capsid protein